VRLPEALDYLYANSWEVEVFKRLDLVSLDVGSSRLELVRKGNDKAARILVRRRLGIPIWYRGTMVDWDSKWARDHKIYCRPRWVTIH
jgi:hypothetical protein